ncbi:hypothetical protein F5J12DRAFT_782344 [Pisolithus orientalis]|uniref:uncharacterized protein n=1 Tax=Pisolithus orientalis TaxID=936130 RepID=UPI002224669F|nr:uncharacterized protein F5J12DRAFT_782344 [Pisolithus orientalis]KAI6008101.1 hypothetical protein F5J12DRAFT_782344 [Pisolithus orientalis]
MALTKGACGGHFPEGDPGALQTVLPPTTAEIEGMMIFWSPWWLVPVRCNAHVMECVAYTLGDHLEHSCQAIKAGALAHAFQGYQGLQPSTLGARPASVIPMAG